MLKIEAHATTDVGRVRRGNEDNYLILDIPSREAVTSAQDDRETVDTRRYDVTEKGIVLAVSDGMGGALAGEVASQMAVETVSRRFADAGDGGPRRVTSTHWLIENPN